MSINQQLSKDELTYFKNRLIDMKKETAARINDNQKDSAQDANHELADFSNHPADMGTEQFEQERAAGFEMMHEDRLQQIDDALSRIEDGTYGVSKLSGKPIPKARLEAAPTATTLVEEKE